MTNLFLIPIVIIFIWMQSKQRKNKQDRYNNFSNDDRNYYLYSTATNDLGFTSRVNGSYTFSFAIGVWQGGEL